MLLDKSHWRLRGPVSTLRIEMTHWDGQLQAWSARMFFQAAVFDKEGRVVQFDQRGPGESIARRATTYDPNGRPLRIEFGTVGGPLDSITTWSYDTDRVTSVMVSLHDGREVVQREESTEDRPGRKMKKILFTHGRKIDGYSIEGSELVYPAPGAVQETIRYDEEERPVDIEFVDASGSVVQRVVMQRDAQGRVVMEEARGPCAAGIQPFKGMTEDDFRKMQAVLEQVWGSTRTMYEYDNDGRLRSQMTQFGRLGDRHVAYRYGDRGNVIEEIERQSDRGMSSDEEGNPHVTPDTIRIRETRYSYIYDVHSNWTERTGSSRMEEGAAFGPAGSQWRTIEYYS